MLNTRLQVSYFLLRPFLVQYLLSSLLVVIKAPFPVTEHRGGVLNWIDYSGTVANLP